MAKQYDYEAALARQINYSNELTRRIIRLEEERDDLRIRVAELEAQLRRSEPVVCLN